MGFLKNLFSKEEPFVPAPTQEVAGLAPLVVQTAETLFPNPDDQQEIFRGLLAAKPDSLNDLVTIQLNILFYSNGKMDEFTYMLVKIKDLDPIRDIWHFKDVKTWAVNVIRAGGYVTKPMY
jgi:hypothetical protein